MFRGDILMEIWEEGQICWGSHCMDSNVWGFLGHQIFPISVESKGILLTTKAKCVVVEDLEDRCYLCSAKGVACVPSMSNNASLPQNLNHKGVR